MVDSDQSKLFIGGISKHASEDTLRDHFGKYGDVVWSLIAKDPNTRSSRGFGFVSFSDPSAVDKALQDTHVILKRTVDVKKAIPRSEQHQNQQQNRGLNRKSRGNGRSNDQFRTKKIFVGGLSPSLTEEEFKSYFEKFGKITDVVVMHDNFTKRPRGFGFITFDSEDAVEDVMKNNFHELSGKSVEVKRAIPKDGNNNSNNGFIARVDSGRGSPFNSHQTYLPYTGYEILPSYGPFSGYGGFAGYPYGTNIFGGGYPTGGYGGIGYGVPPVPPRSLWDGHAVVGVRGSPLPYGSAATVYLPYLNGGVGVTGLAANGYDETVGLATDEKHAQINGENVDINSSGLEGSC
ncbi:heterogeneous nuclear ribonucleoprotein 1-like [Cornus florida]|uniref:heterogeneous nuclear ribonucleoprotein 1-like n=1 Tax=Cornus florida TaxID=4283 RepID=UPI0028985BD8|nr:heterogeneous nuclear ribonucleoprotein 1-like [Cornus florida]